MQEEKKKNKKNINNYQIKNYFFLGLYSYLYFFFDFFLRITKLDNIFFSKLYS